MTKEELVEEMKSWIWAESRGSYADSVDMGGWDEAAIAILRIISEHDKRVTERCSEIAETYMVTSHPLAAKLDKLSLYIGKRIAAAIRASAAAATPQQSTPEPSTSDKTSSS